MDDFLKEIEQVKYTPPKSTNAGRNFSDVSRTVKSIIEKVKRNFLAQASISRHLSVKFSFYASISDDLAFFYDQDGTNDSTLNANVTGSREEIDFFFEKLVVVCNKNHIKVRIFARNQSIGLIGRILWGGVYSSASGLKYLALAWPNVRPEIEFYMDL